jgi:3-hydroxyacyl-CoA dehydrogenase
MKIAFLGTGLMGSGFVRRLLAQGHTVHVWNRSPASAKALEDLGAKAFAASAEAVSSGGPSRYDAGGGRQGRRRALHHVQCQGCRAGGSISVQT